MHAHTFDPANHFWLGFEQREWEREEERIFESYLHSWWYGIIQLVNVEWMRLPYIYYSVIHQTHYIPCLTHTSCQFICLHTHLMRKSVSVKKNNTQRNQITYDAWTRFKHCCYQLVSHPKKKRNMRLQTR